MSDINKLIQALRDYKQADEAGVMVLVSRQACDEAAELLSRSAGVWVPVTERLPKDSLQDWVPVVCLNDRELDIQMVYAGKWVDVEGSTTHWLDVRLPGEQRVDQVE